MSQKTLSRAQYRRAQAGRPAHAALFAALGDKTRLALLSRLSRGRPASISQLTSGSRLTRQAITKHLCVLERAGVVRGTRVGRENLFALDPEPIEWMRDYLAQVSTQWDDALARLKSFVED
jgi:DNA-binding transcriptional ArsR family regulator